MSKLKMDDALKRFALGFLRYSLGLIFLWFGLLKVFGISPAEELVSKTTHWTGVHNLTIFLGFWESILGLCFFFRRLLVIAGVLFLLHIPGTFLPLFLNPEDCFTHIPYGLTLEGQYIVKNFILIGSVAVLFVFREYLQSDTDPKN